MRIHKIKKKHRDTHAVQTHKVIRAKLNDYAIATAAILSFLKQQKKRLL